MQKALLLASIAVIAVTLNLNAADMPVVVQDGKATGGGKSDYVIVLSATPEPAERTAAAELREHLARVAGAKLEIRAEGEVPADVPQIVIGQTQRTRQWLPALNVQSLPPDAIVMKTVGRSLVLTGRPPRGPLYAVYTLLEDVIGCRWWTSTESFVPQRPTLVLPTLDVNYAPPLWYREAFYRDARNGVFAARSKCNGNSDAITAEYGGHHQFAGFVHTFYPLLPPEKHFAAHPEWYSELRGKRTWEYGQLCLTNAEMRKALAQAALQRLRSEPQANLISVSQNDWEGRCECPRCRALEQAEGSPAGPLLDTVNYVAEQIERVRPDVLVETLAYQYTQRPPRHVRPRPNVVVRLCSIECSFVEPLSGPQNEAFRRDIEGWSRIAPHLFVWDYVTNFQNFILPYPNMRVLAPNIRFFVDHHVIGLFEQGDSECSVGDFVQLRAWLLAHLMWNPRRDPHELIREFTVGYYGPAAPHVMAYLEHIHDAAERSGMHLKYSMADTSSWLSLADMNAATRLMNQAAAAVADDPVISARLRRERLSLDHAWLQRYDALRRAARRTGEEFLGPNDPAGTVEEFIALGEKLHANRYAEGHPFAELADSLRRSFRPPVAPPPQCANLSVDDWMDMQDHRFRLAGRREWVDRVEDPRASDGSAVRMPGSHCQWGLTCPLPEDVNDAPAWHCYVVARCEAKATSGPAMTMGIYDAQAKRGVAQRAVSVQESAGAAYRVFDLGEHPLTRTMYVWVAPPQRPDEVTAVYVDRMFFVRKPRAMPAGQGKL